jgi:hypothetical protein
MTAHYLNVSTYQGEPVEWEYVEQSMSAQVGVGMPKKGRTARRRFKVPLFLDPNDPGDYNYPGMIIVAWEDSAEGDDIVFEGNPTPDMEPFDGEAREISAKLAQHWEHPIESLPGNYGSSLIADFETQIDRLSRVQAAAPAAKADDKVLTQLQEQLEALMAQNTAMAERLEALETPQ